MLVGHLKLEEDYKQLDEKINAPEESEEPQGEDEDKAKNREADLQERERLIERIKQSVRNMVRYFHDKRGTLEKLREMLCTKKSSKVHEFVGVFGNQYEVFRQRMTTSKEEEDSKSEQLKLLEEKVRVFTLTKTIDCKTAKREARKN